MREKIISNTVMFVLILGFMTIFENVFGSTNKMVGIVVLIIGLVISEKDLTQNLGILTIQLLSVNLLMGLFSYLTLLNPILGLIINICFIFLVTYATVEGNKKPYHFPFILGYLFLTLVAPPVLSELPGRLIALTGGTLIIVGLQWLFNRKTYNQVLKAQMDQVLSCLNHRMEQIAVNNNKDSKEIVSPQDGMSRFMKVTHDRKSFNQVLTKESMEHITEIITFEKMYYLLDKIEKDYVDGLIDPTYIEDLRVFIKELKQGELSDVSEFITKWEQQELTPSAIELNQSIRMLKVAKNQTFVMSKEGIFKQWIKAIDYESMACKFSLRLAVLVGLSLFIVQLFDLTYGRWFCFTILALVQPGFEESRKKMVHRFIGTLSGVVIFILLFSLFKQDSQRILIVLGASYIGMYMNRYDLKMTWVTIQALGAAIIGTTGPVVVENRVFYIVLGGIVAYVGSKYLFPIYQHEMKQHYLTLYEQSKKHLWNHPTTYPHTGIVQAYHYLQVGEIEKEKYQEWLNLSYQALTQSV